MHSDIIIAAAVYEELSQLLDRVEKPVVSRVGGREIVSGRIEGKAVRLLVTGPGLVNTVQSLTAAIENFRPALIIQTGCAGAFKESGLRIGDIGIATEEIDLHLGIEPENGSLLLKDLPFSLIKRHGLNVKNRYSINNELVEIALQVVKKASGSDKVRFKKGPFITVSTITATEKRAKDIYKHFRPCIESMEGSGAAYLSLYYDIPFLEIRSVSNIVGKRDLTAWNLPLAFERGNMAVFALIGNLSDRIFTTEIAENTEKKD
ncbi:MAG: futalosine hydrolase [Desulfobacteraceae bacterium Eth-SRB1]|nr:MAG: futalosine hydrolase [Desulfobacteraceae bacterium Eth-SRB1]